MKKNTIVLVAICTLIGGAIGAIADALIPVTYVTLPAGGDTFELGEIAPGLGMLAGLMVGLWINDRDRLRDSNS